MTTAFYVIPEICDDCEEGKATRAYFHEGFVWFCCERCFLDAIEVMKQ